MTENFLRTYARAVSELIWTGDIHRCAEHELRVSAWVRRANAPSGTKPHHIVPGTNLWYYEVRKHE